MPTIGIWIFNSTGRAPPTGFASSSGPLPVTQAARPPPGVHKRASSGRADPNSVGMIPASAGQARSSRNAAGAPDQISPYSRISPPPANDPFFKPRFGSRLSFKPSNSRDLFAHNNLVLETRRQF